MSLAPSEGTKCTSADFQGANWTPAQAQAYHSCNYFEAMKDAQYVQWIIAGIQSAASLYFADKQYDIAKLGQDRLDDTWQHEKAWAEELQNFWKDNYKACEATQAQQACERVAVGYTVDYDTVMARSIEPIRREFSRARAKLERESNVHCTGSTCYQTRLLDIAESKAITAATNQAWRDEENRKDVKEAGYREERYKVLGVGRGVIGDSLNALRTASFVATQASKINPYEGYERAVGGILGTAGGLVSQNAMFSAGNPFVGGYGGITSQNSTYGQSNSGVQSFVTPQSTSVLQQDKPQYQLDSGTHLNDIGFGTGY